MEMSMNEVKKELQDAVELYNDEIEVDTYKGEAFVIEDVLEDILIEYEKCVPHDVREWFHVWQAFTILDSADVRLHPYFDYGDEQSDSFGYLLKAIEEWK